MKTHISKQVTLLLLPAFLMAILAGCGNNNSNKSDGDEKARTGASSKRVAYRQGINANNAYSTLFLDSSRLEKYIQQQHIKEETANGIRDFYNNRAFQFAWFTDSGFTEQALAFRSLYDYDKDSTTRRTTLDNRLDELLNADSLHPAADDPDIIATELQMSWRLVNFLSDKFSDEDKRNAAIIGMVPFKKQTMDDWTKQFANDQVRIAAKNDLYEKLQKKLQETVALRNKGGWESLPVSVKLYSRKKPDALTARLKRRLQQTGYLVNTDTSSSFTAALSTAIRKAQAAYGFPHDTVLTANLLKELNIPINTRIAQLLINLERMRWMPELPNGEYIVVNIPEFRLHVLNGSSKEFDMDIITGKEGNGTVMFSGAINQVVFSPYWNLPPSIVKKEVLPKISANKNWLKEQHMEITGDRNGLPVVRQLPGEWNELGRVKFLFPNSLNIYFHDTPHKWLFNKDQRAYSHGCIRLAEPEKMAAFLLKDEKAWTADKIDSAMNGEKEKYVRIPKPVPVLIYYYTAWVNEEGELQLRKDIYGHDTDFGKRMFINNSILASR